MFNAERKEVVVSVALITVALVLRYAMQPQLDALDDAGYLEAALRVAEGRSLDNMFPLFRTRVGMAYPLGWMLKSGLLQPSQFWVLTWCADFVTLSALYAAARWLTGQMRAGLLTAGIYAIYPFAVQQSMMFYPTAFQTMFLSVALAILCAAERNIVRSTALAGLASGVAIGVAYLVKEDAALLVPAIVGASLLAGFPRRSLVIWMAAGAAAVFFVESAAYFATTGHATYRLTATSALEGGSNISSQLQISNIFKADAYLRSLFLVPVQVGLIWWLGIPAVWSAWRTRDPRLRFLAFLFLIVAVYLQFGSSSISSYAPLPKTPRYTVIVGPVLMILIGCWLSRMWATGRRPLALILVAAVIVTALPCLLFLHITSSERSRNTFQAARRLQELDRATLYTDFYSARLLRVLAPNLKDVKVWYHANFEKNVMLEQSNPADQPGAYALLDRQAAKIYTSSYQFALPANVAATHGDWQTLWTTRAYPEGSFARQLLELARSTTHRMAPETALDQRVQRSVADLVDHDDATLFRIP